MIEPLSLDEAYLDVTENHLGLPSGTEAAVYLRARVREELGLTCSVGVAPLKFVAKIASDWNKPDGLTVVRPDRVLEFIHPLPVRKLWGVGPATEKRLLAMGAHTVAQLSALPRSLLEERLGKRGFKPGERAPRVPSVCACMCCSVCWVVRSTPGGE